MVSAARLSIGLGVGIWGGACWAADDVPATKPAELPRGPAAVSAPLPSELAGLRGDAVSLPRIDTAPVTGKPLVELPPSTAEKLQEATRSENWLEASLAALRTETPGAGLTEERTKRDARPADAFAMDRRGMPTPLPLVGFNLPGTSNVNRLGSTGRGSDGSRDGLRPLPTPAPNPYLQAPETPRSNATPPSGDRPAAPVVRGSGPSPLPTPIPTLPTLEELNLRQLPRF